LGGAPAYLLLVRHARAGDREEWIGDDRRRPLDDRGRAQAAALPELLAAYPIERILSSPADRCVQTVGPLASARGLEIEVWEELSEERQSVDGADLVRGLLSTAVAVSCHGGLAEAVTGESQKKAETLVLDERGRLVERLRPR
jgi:phosphohistidine phosphatase SixA